MLLIFYSGIRISNLLHSLITYLPQNKLGFAFDTNNILNLAGTQMNLCLRSLLHALMRVDYSNTYRVHKFLKKFAYEQTQLQFTDLDIALSIYLTDMISRGKTYSEFIDKIRVDFSINAQLIPICDTPLPIQLKSGTKIISFNKYVNSSETDLKFQEVEFPGYEEKKPNQNLKEIANGAEYILLLPNDLIAFEAILRVPGIKKILEEVPCPIFAIAPFCSTYILSEKRLQVLSKLGYPELNALELALKIQNLADTLIIDESQKTYKEEITSLGFQVNIKNLAIKNKHESFELATYLFNLFPLKETVRPSKLNVVGQFFSRFVKKKM